MSFDDTRLYLGYDFLKDILRIPVYDEGEFLSIICNAPELRQFSNCVVLFFLS